MVATYHRHMPQPVEPTTHLDLRTGIVDPTFELTHSTVVVREWFRVLERLDPAT